MEIGEYPAGDALSAALTGLTFGGWVVCLSDLSAPWGVSLPGGRLGAAHIVLSGRCFVTMAGSGARVELNEDELVFLPADRVHKVSDAPDTEAIEASQIAGLQIADSFALSLALGGGGEKTRILTISFSTGSDLHTQIFAGLPELIKLSLNSVSNQAQLRATLQAIEVEMATAHPGYLAILRRLAEIFFVQLMRAVSLSDVSDRGWLFALSDPRLQKALGLMHNQFARPWRLADLARACGMSRTSFCDRFTEKVGVPPMTYLNRVRMSEATQRLKSPGARIADVAEQVGYASAASFSRAYRDIVGSSPSEVSRSPGVEPLFPATTSS